MVHYAYFIKILLLDEATSHLDKGREHEVVNAIKKLRLTRLIIAHRDESIIIENNIVEINSGEVKFIAAEKGPQRLIP
jgi:ATP-binding cassette subfamily B protein RaxB